MVKLTSTEDGGSESCIEHPLLCIKRAGVPQNRKIMISFETARFPTYYRVDVEPHVVHDGSSWGCSICFIVGRVRNWFLTSTRDDIKVSVPLEDISRTISKKYDD